MFIDIYINCLNNYVKEIQFIMNCPIAPFSEMKRGVFDSFALLPTETLFGFLLLDSNCEYCKLFKVINQH